MRNILVFVTAVAFNTYALAAPVYAQDPLAGLNGDGTVEVGELPEDSKIPLGKPCEVDGERFQCFTLDEMKSLLEFEAELRYFETSYIKIFKKVDLLEQQVQLKDVQIFELEEQKLVLKGERDRLYSKWEEENRLRLEAENKPKFGNPIAWGLAGTFLLSTIGLSLALAFK